MDAQDPRLQVALVGLWGLRDLTPAGCAQPAERFVPLLVRAGINRDVLSATFGRGRRPASATGRRGPFQPVMPKGDMVLNRIIGGLAG